MIQNEFIPRISPRRALEDAERRIAILERSLSRYDLQPVVISSANRAELARLREVAALHRRELEGIRQARLEYTARMHRIHRRIAAQHYAEHLSLLEESGHARNGKGTA